MQFEKNEVNQAIAWAMKVPVGSDYLDEDGDDFEVFKLWAEPQLNTFQLEMYDMLRSTCGTTIALVSAMQIMDKWTAQL